MIKPPNQRSPRLDFFLPSLCGGGADRVVAVSQGVATDIVRSFPKIAAKVHVIYNPIISPSLLAKAQEPLSHPWFSSGTLPVVLGVGRLIILGDGPERERLEALVHELGLQKPVQLLGFQENSYPFFLRSAVFVLSSRWEGMPTVLIEALALGIPVVSTRCPSGPEEILSGEWGERLVAMGDEETLAKTIIETLEAEPSQRSVPSAVDRILALFEQYSIHATWAVVGMLLFQTKDDLLESIPEQKPQ